ncbi:MAG: anthranilate phosphoribosyltransferase [Dysgonamonadaceae bacterium]|jgi:anthranilate phosphoribosyltransferase|nr:anthranilate phosphoribosyltransferase [Dysgonamonadaceae bacterium]
MKEILYRLFDHQYLSKEEAKEVLTDIAAGKFNDSQIAAFVSVYLMRSITLEELSGFREALLEMCIPAGLSDYDVIDIVGTGGDNKNTFNISTASCFVLAGAGYKVVKHGNYGATSISGASNVMESHGVKFTADRNVLLKSVEESNIAFLHAPLFNPALKNVAGVRRQLGVRTFFNVLGPLVNPVQPKNNMLGVFNLRMGRLYYYMYQQLGGNFSVVHSLDGYDEISLTGEFKVITPLEERIYTPEQLGFSRLREQDLSAGNSVEDAAVIFDNVLKDKATEAQKKVVTVNSAFAIRTLSPGLSIEECIDIAKTSIERGNALDAFKKFLKINGV